MALRVDDERLWTYEDYCQLPEDGQRYEVIGERLYMTPAPSLLHQLVVQRLYEAFLPLRDQGSCILFLAPTEVRIEQCDPVQPDLIVLRGSQTSLLTKNFISGAPALLIEVLSPSNQRHDRVTKLRAYARAGVEHYWLASPEDRILEMLRLRGDNYEVVSALGPGERAESPDWPGFHLELDELFRPLPED